MTDQTRRTATCGCGALLIETTGAPERAMLCSCRSCQDRTGSGISLSAYWQKDQIVIRGAATEWVRECQDGRQALHRFCPTCGTTLWWTMDVFPGLIGVAGGAFAEGDFLEPAKAYWASLRPLWVNRIQTVETLDRQGT